MHLLPMTYPTFVRELLVARAGLTLAAQVGLAVRADRRRLRMSQRRYACHRGWSPSRVVRLESGAGELKLADVEAALEGTRHVLALCHRPPSGPEGPTPVGGVGLPVPVVAEDWPRTELVARVRDGSRRFPAHHDTRQVDIPPLWWWSAESTIAGSRAPDWYAPRPAGNGPPDGLDPPPPGAAPPDGRAA